MVELTEVKDEEKFNVEKDALTTRDSDKIILDDRNDFEDEEDVEDDDDLDSIFDENESVWERIEALKDIIPPKQRHAITSKANAVGSIFRSIFNKGTSLTWTITTSALLLGVPLSLSILAEQQLIEMERSFDLQKDAGELLGSNEETAKAAA